MFIKYSPCKYDKDTAIEITGENTLIIDGESYEFDSASVEWDPVELQAQTDGLILDAHRDINNQLYLTVRRFYTSDLSWDSGDYHAILPEGPVVSHLIENGVSASEALSISQEVEGAANGS